LSHFSAYIPWNSETKKIVLKNKDQYLTERAVSAHKPTVRIVSPKGGETWGAKATISWRASDQDGGKLTFSVLYNTGRDANWIPLAVGVKQQSITVDTKLLAGSKTAHVRVQATDGVNTAEADSAATFVVPEKPPLVAILGLKNGATVSAENSNLVGAAYELQDGIMLGNNLTWSSSRGGALGAGSRVTPRKLAAGTQTITLTATNSRGQKTTAKVNVTVRGKIVPGRKFEPPSALRFPVNSRQ